MVKNKSKDIETDLHFIRELISKLFMFVHLNKFQIFLLNLFQIRFLLVYAEN